MKFKNVLIFCLLILIALVFFVPVQNIHAAADSELHHDMYFWADNTYGIGSTNAKAKYIRSYELSTMRINYGVVSNTGGDLSLTITCDYLPDLSPGTILTFLSTSPNTTGAIQISLDGGTTWYQVMSLHNQDPAANYIENGSYVVVGWDGTRFQLLTPDANP